MFDCIISAPLSEDENQIVFYFLFSNLNSLELIFDNNYHSNDTSCYHFTEINSDLKVTKTNIPAQQFTYVEFYSLEMRDK